MTGLETIGRWLLIAGIGLAVLGGLVWLLAKVFPNLSQFPGTIRIEGAGVTCVFPLLASIVLSILLSILLNVIARIIK
jgi:hypothetical protein